MNLTLRGYCDLTIAQISIAVNLVIGKYLLTFLSPFLVLGFRFAFSSLFLFVIVLLNGFQMVGPEHPTGRPVAKDWALLWGQALTAGFLFNFFFIYGVQMTTATTAGIIASILPAMIAIFSFWMLGERLTTHKQMAIALAMLGIVILSVGGAGESGLSDSSLLGNFLVFIALIPEALYSILVKLLGRRMNVLSAAFFTNVFTWILLCPLMWMAWQDAPESLIMPMAHWGLLMAGGLATVLFYCLWSRGLQIIPTNTAGIFGSVLPVATTFIAAIFLGEHLSSYDFAGMLFVILSIFIGTGMIRRENSTI